MESLSLEGLGYGGDEQEGHEGREGYEVGEEERRSGGDEEELHECDEEEGHGGYEGGEEKSRHGGDEEEGRPGSVGPWRSRQD